MKLYALCLALLLALSFAQTAGGGDKKKFRVHIKKAQRRTGTEVLKDIQSNPDDIVNVVVFYKENPSNPVSSKENPKEINMYEKFFKNLEAGWDGCTVNKDFTVDVVEVTDPLAEELLLKLGVDKDKKFEKRTMALVMRDGLGAKIQGPTAYLKLVEELTKDDADYLSDSDGACAKAFFDKKEQAQPAPAGGAR